MSSMADVDISLSALREGGAEDISILHCTTNYPCAYENVNLKSMVTLRDAFHLPVGYSDHTMGKDVAVAAVALGATIIEKHFTLDCNMEGPDHAASTEPADFAELVKTIRRTERFLGDGIKRPTEEEKKIAEVVTKRIVAAKEIKKGDILSVNNLCVKRNNVGIGVDQWDFVLGRTAGKNYCVDEGIII